MSSLFMLTLTGLVFMGFIFNKKHFLMALINLEAIMLFLAVNFFFSSASLLFLFLLFITLSACEGALGLSILVNLTRSYSSDYLMMLNMLI